MGGMLGGGWTRAHRALQNSAMSKHVLITFLFTANPLSLFFFSPVQKTEPSAQHVELPLTAAARLLEVWQG